MRVDIGVVPESLFDFLFFQSQFFWIIAGHGMRRMVLHVKAAARDEVVVELLLIFDRFDAKKDSAETKGGDQENTDQFLFADLRGPYSHGHGQAAQDKHDGIAGTECDIQGVAADTEGRAEGMAGNGVGPKKAPEEQNFGDQKKPHAEPSGFLLLLRRFKMSVQFPRRVHSVLLFAIQRMASNCAQRARDPSASSG